MDGNERRALDAIARDAGIEGKGSHLDEPLSNETLGVLMYGIESMTAYAANCRQHALGVPATLDLPSLEVRMAKFRAARTKRELLLVAKPHILALAEVLQTIEPKEEV